VRVVRCCICGTANESLIRLFLLEKREKNMAKSDKPSKPGKPGSSPDKLVKTGKKVSIELTEDELKKVSGGVVFLKGGT
jgi:bacteriocin-like protein